MAYSPIEDRYLETLTQQQFPDMQPQEVATEPSMDGVQLAEVGATKMADYGYSGQRQATMTDYDPTVRERMSEFLQAGFEKFGMDRYKARQNAQTLLGGGSSNLPLNMGIADIVPFLGTALQTQEAARMGEESITSAKQGNYGTAALQAGGAVLGMIPGAVGTVKAAKMLPKNLPVGMSTEAVGGMDAVLKPAKAVAPVSDTGFYSAVEQAALNVQRKSGSGQSFLNDITKGENVKADEVKWIGLDDFLKGKKNVTREEVQQYIAANKVDVQEVTLGGQEKFDAQRLSQLESEYKALKDHPIDDPSFGEDKYDEMIKLMNIRDQSTTQSLYDAADRAMSSAQRAQRQGNRITAEKYFREAELLNTRAEKLDLQGQGMSNPPRYDKYQLPGGENYREILLTTPTNMGEYNNYVKQLRAKYGDGGFANLPLTEVERARLYKFYANEDTQPFKSSHWDQPNVLAHIRVNDRVDADGKKMLLVEEVQSDWHQAGRDKGYGKVQRYEYEAVQDNGQLVRSFRDKGEAEAFAKERGLKLNEIPFTVDTGVPDAPMKDTWYQLALKRVLKYAADNGYDRIGLTTGSRQAERFDLSKQVDELLYKRNEDGTYRLSAQTGSRGNLLGEAIPESKLSDYVGKEVAKSIIEGSGKNVNLGGAGTVSQPKDIWKSMSGLDLQVGGEGMKKYYDEVYPQFLSKYAKKWNAKVGDTYLPIYDNKTSKSGAEPIRFVDITPEMRQSVGKGQPLFSATAAGAGTGAATMQDKEKK